MTYRIIARLPKFVKKSLEYKLIKQAVITSKRVLPPYSSLGIFNAGENFASAGGSALTALISDQNTPQAYFMGFFGFSLAFFLWVDFLNKRAQVKA